MHAQFYIEFYKSCFIIVILQKILGTKFISSNFT